MTDLRILLMLDQACGGDFGVLGRLWRSDWHGISLEQLFLAEPLDPEAIQLQLQNMAFAIDRYRKYDADRRDSRSKDGPRGGRNPLIDEMPWCSLSDPD